MSKVTHINSGDYYALDCGHVLNDFDVEGALKKDAEVDCPVCADNETQVKAARVEALKEMRQELCHITALELTGHWRAIQNTFDGIFDKLILEAE